MENNVIILFEAVLFVVFAIFVVCWIISFFFDRYRYGKIKKELENLSENALWAEWFKIYDVLHGKEFEAYKEPEETVVLRHNLILKELDRRDLLAVESAEERSFADSLKGYSDLLVENTFMREWILLEKNCEHPRLRAIYFSIAREEFLNRCRCKYAKMSDDALKKIDAELSQKYQNKYVPRDVYEEYHIVKAEMGKRRLAL